MSVISGAKQTSSEHFVCAKEALAKSWLKRETTTFNSASVAITSSSLHTSGIFESRTHLLDITSEQGALAIAAARKDPKVEEIVSVVDGEFILNPLVIKTLCDHARRTSTPIAYSVYDPSGKKLFYSEDVSKLYYSPSPIFLDKISTWEQANNWFAFDSKISIGDQLRKAAIIGMQAHFSSDTKTSYGAAVLSEGKIYFGGVYSSFDHRMNLHSEMVAALSAIMDGNRKISCVGIISNKFIDEIPHMCGCCRQFFSEIQEKTKVPITVLSFSFDGAKIFEKKLDEYLPSVWHSGQTFDDRSKR